jgi:hypothetical protein
MHERLVFLIVATCLMGCTAWRLDEDWLSAPVPVRKPLEIWSEGRGAVVHGVQQRGDTVRAVARWRPPECDTCAIFFPFSSIDSVRTRRFSSGRTIGLVAAATAVLLIYSLSQMEPTLPGPQ